MEFAVAAATVAAGFSGYANALLAEMGLALPPWLLNGPWGDGAGGAPASGTNDKAGAVWNLMRWVSPRTIKETFVPPTDYRYAFLQEGDGARPAAAAP